jgi:hypothetical protein
VAVDVGLPAVVLAAAQAPHGQEDGDAEDGQDADPRVDAQAGDDRVGLVAA